MMINVSPRSPVDDISFESKDFHQKGSMQTSTFELHAISPTANEGFKALNNVPNLVHKNYLGDINKSHKPKVSIKDQIIELLKKGSSEPNRSPAQRKEELLNRLIKIIRTKTLPKVRMMLRRRAGLFIPLNGTTSGFIPQVDKISEDISKVDPILASKDFFGSSRLIPTQSLNRKNSRTGSQLERQRFFKRIEKKNGKSGNFNIEEDKDNKLSGRISIFLLINPDNTLYLVWKTITALIIAFLQAHAGFILAFSLVETDMYPYSHPIILTCYGIIAFDCMTTLNTMYYDKGQLVSSRKDIVKRGFKQM